MHSLFGFSPSRVGGTELVLTVEVGPDTTYDVPVGVVSSAAFQQTVLGRFVASTQETFQLPGRGVRLEKVDSCRIRVVFDESGDNVDDEGNSLRDSFGLWIQHISNRRPLEATPFSLLVRAHTALIAQCKLFSPSSQSLPELPYRLWTARRWSDLTGCYPLSQEEAALLQMEPVATQLPDGTVQGVRLLRRMDIAARKAEIAALLTCPDEELPQVTAAFEFLECRLIYLNTREDAESANSIEIGCPVSASALAASDAVTSGDTSGDNKAGSVQATCANVILIALPTSHRVVSYDLPKGKVIRLPPQKISASCCEFPAFYRRSDRFVFVLNRNFSLEVQDITDAVTGQVKVRVGVSRIGVDSRPASSPSQSGALSSLVNSDNTPAAATAVMNLFKGERKPRKEMWQCFHPELAVRYSPLDKWLRDLGEVETVKIFSWGAVLVLSKVESPFAAISIDHPDLRALYGERIIVCIRGIPPGMSREDIDITVTAGLERVYICAFGQIASASIVPQQPRIDFEIAADAANRQYKLKLAHIDVPEGGPTGASLKFLHCIGMLVEFKPSTCLYYQNGPCRELCRRYTTSGASSGGHTNRKAAVRQASVKSTLRTTSASTASRFTDNERFGSAEEEEPLTAHSKGEA